MAHIICKYYEPCCRNGHDPFMTGYNEYCCEGINCREYASKGELAGQKRFLNRECRFFFYKLHSFETTVRKYDFESDGDFGGWLSIKGQVIGLEFGDYLEIDGEVLIGEKKNETPS